MAVQALNVSVDVLEGRVEVRSRHPVFSLQSQINECIAKYHQIGYSRIPKNITP